MSDLLSCEEKLVLYRKLLLKIHKFFSTHYKRDYDYGYWLTKDLSKEEYALQFEAFQKEIESLKINE